MTGKNDTQKSQPVSTANPFPVLPAEFGRYRILQLLGRGGMGAVYLAQDSQLGRQVALKVPFFDTSESADRAERFVREARSAAALHHPNICTIYDAGQIDGRPFITMAYLAGTPLDKKIDPDDPMTQARAVEIVRKIALALEHAHARGIVHRDLKPANVMMTGGEPVVMDFGLAKQVVAADPSEVKLTRDGAAMGTPSYMAPEQVRGEAAAIGPATDVYALGVMLFELLTGRTPYVGTLGVVMGQILAAPPPHVREFRADVHPRLDAICLKAMAKEPAARFRRMAELARALDHYLQNPSAPPPPAPPPTVRPRRTSVRTKVPAPTVHRSTIIVTAVDPLPEPAVQEPKGGRVVTVFVVFALLLALVCLVAIVFFGVDPKHYLPQVAWKVPTGETNNVTPEETGKGTPEETGKGTPEETSKAHPVATTKEITNSIGMKFVRIAAKGKAFTMGSPATEAGREKNETQHEVTFTKDFYLGKHPVTRGQFRKFVEDTGYQTEAEAANDNATWRKPGIEQTDEHPVVCVSWNDAVTFAAWLSHKERQAYRLPTEAEWEYACRGGQSASRPFGIGDGTSLDSGQANFDGNFPYGGAAKGVFRQTTTPVGSFKPNAFGLYDMHGNVWQWCVDCYGAYPTGRVTDPAGPAPGAGLPRVFRGGSWADAAGFCRSANRRGNVPSLRNILVGFRLVCVPSGR